jgi:hypothetical protein
VTIASVIANMISEPRLPPNSISTRLGMRSTTSASFICRSGASTRRRMLGTKATMATATINAASTISAIVASPLSSSVSSSRSKSTSEPKKRRTKIEIWISVCESVSMNPADSAVATGTPLRWK